MTADHAQGVALAPGSAIGGRYVVEAVLGSGGFGVVYKAHDKVFEGVVAVKEFLPADVSTRGDDGCTVVPRTPRDAGVLAEGVTAFLGEARRLKTLRNRNIVEVTDFVHAHETGYLVMPYEDGETLGDLLSRGEVLSNDELLEITDQVLSGLAYTHERKLLHRDVSPGNLFIKRDGTVLLIDFGASRQAIGERSRSMSAIVKPGYAPFEQYHAKGNQGAWTDLYSLGATLYRCVTGEPPPVATERMEAVVEARPDPIRQLGGSRYEAAFSAPLLKFIDRLLVLQVSGRPQSVSQARAALTAGTDPDGLSGSGAEPIPRWIAEPPVPPPPPPPSRRAAPPPSSPPPPPSSQASRPPRRLSLAAVTGIAAVIVIAVVISGWVAVSAYVDAAIYVTSVPTGADVTVDGVARGTTPLRWSSNPGSHTVEVSQDGYIGQGQIIQLSAGDLLRLTFELAAVTERGDGGDGDGTNGDAAADPVTSATDAALAQLTVRSNVSADSLYIDDAFLGSTGPSRHAVSAGEHSVKVTKRYYRDWIRSVTMASGEVRTLFAELEIDPSSCETADNDRCDEPGVCPAGTDAADCAVLSGGGNAAGQNSCRFANDNECDEPGLCPVGTDTADCAASELDRANSCQFANDNECDEPGLCAVGTDSADCAVRPLLGDTCQYALDNECDEPTLCGVGTDSRDCAADVDFGRDLSQYANDDECDDPRFEGDGMAATTLVADRRNDASDCRSLFLEGRIRLR